MTSSPSVRSRGVSTSTPRYHPTQSQTAAQSTTCPSCGTTLPPAAVPLCPSCSAILPPAAPSSSSTHYALFGLGSPSFKIDKSDLKRAFLNLQQKVHPDLFGGQGEKELWAGSWSGAINEGYKALNDDLSRAEYLLSLHDIEVGEAEKVADPLLLMDVMETREALDDASTEEEVAQIRSENRDKINDTLVELQQAFEGGVATLEEAKNLTTKLRYLNNIDGVCREWSPGSRGDVVH